MKIIRGYLEENLHYCTLVSKYKETELARKAGDQALFLLSTIEIESLEKEYIPKFNQFKTANSLF